jgi:RNA-directed DNA polymerase
VATACIHKEIDRNTGSPSGDRRKDQPATRERQAGPSGVAERPVIPVKPRNGGGGKGPQFEENVERSEGEEIGVNLRTPETVQKLQTALHAKAKGSPGYRFYALYDKIYREDILAFAYECARANGGAPGEDGQSFEDIEAYGAKRWRGELAEELQKQSYHPQAVRRVYIPKPDGSKRPLGIPTIRDRVVQTAAVLVLEPIFEADLQPEQYAYRRDRSALDAIRAVHALLNTGHREVVDADWSGYFDSIPHAELMKSVARRVSDPRVLHLIKMWLEAPVEEINERGQKRRTTRNKDAGRGTPQGAPISPLLSNLYMRRFVLGWKSSGHARRLHARVVNYADDFVICCRGTAKEARQAMQDMMRKLRLTVNEAKTQVCRVPDESFDFLGYTMGRCWSNQTGRAYIGTRPSRKRMARICRAISEETSRRWVLTDVQERVAKLNRILVGWSNYFCLGAVSKAYHAVDQHAEHRLRQWLCRKHKVRSGGKARFSEQYVYQTLGLVQLSQRTHNFPWAQA